MIKTKFGHIGLNCLNIDKTVAFYRKHFGFKVARVVPLGKGNKIVFVKSEGAYFELFKAKGAGKAVKNDGPAEAGFRHMAFAVSDVAGKIKAMGRDAKVMLGPLDFGAFIKGWKGAWLKDPDGRIIELAQGYKDDRK